MVNERSIHVGAVKLVLGLADDILLRFSLRNAIIRQPYELITYLGSFARIGFSFSFNASIAALVFSLPVSTFVTASIAAASNSGQTAICGYLSIRDDSGISSCGRYGFISNREESEMIDFRPIAAAPDSK